MQSPESVAPISNETAEELIIGLILSRPEAIEEVAHKLLPMAFSNRAYREIYHTALMLHTQNAAPTSVAVMEWLQDVGQLDEGMREALLKCQAVTLIRDLRNTAFFDVLMPAVRLVMTKYLRRVAVALGSELIVIGSDFSVPIEEVVGLLTSNKAELLQMLLPDCIEQSTEA